MKRKTPENRNKNRALLGWRTSTSRRRLLSLRKSFAFYVLRASGSADRRLKPWAVEKYQHSAYRSVTFGSFTDERKSFFGKCSAPGAS